MQTATSPQPDPTQAAPFVRWVERVPTSQRGTWEPKAQVRFEAGLRTSGLLLTIPAEELRSLLFLLSFVSPDGRCNPALSQVADAMRSSHGKARSRLERLVGWRWHGQSIVGHSQAENGLEFYSPLPNVAAFHEPMPVQQEESAPLQGGNREAVIAYSRQRYARPRAEVERDILRRLGRKELDEEAAPTNLEHEETRRQLLAAGLNEEQAESLLSRYDLVRIRRQLAWLPYRGAKNPTGLLLAAVKDDYEMPPNFNRN